MMGNMQRANKRITRKRHAVIPNETKQFVFRLQNVTLPYIL